jgi:AcrR family transcriptional regulator
MPRAALAEPEIHDFRRRAVEVATRLFAEHGYAGVSLRRISDELGVSPMTPYRYFEDKAEIFAMVRAEAYARFADAQAAAFDSTDHPLLRLGALREAYLDFALAEPNAYRVMFELAQEPAEAYPELLRESDRAFQVLLQAVREAIDAGATEGDPLDVAHVLWASVHGLVTLHLAGKLTLGRDFDRLRDVPFPVFRFPEPKR